MYTTPAALKFFKEAIFRHVQKQGNFFGGKIIKDAKQIKNNLRPKDLLSQQRNEWWHKIMLVPSLYTWSLLEFPFLGLLTHHPDVFFPVVYASFYQTGEKRLSGFPLGVSKISSQCVSFS